LLEREGVGARESDESRGRIAWLSMRRVVLCIKRTGEKLGGKPEEKGDNREEEVENHREGDLTENVR